MNADVLKSWGKQFSLAAIIIAFATFPLPGFEGNPTGFKYFHDHAEKWIKRNEQAISNTHETVVAMDDRKGLQFQIWQLETLILQVEESEKLPEDRKTRLINRYEKKLDGIEKKLEKKDDRIDELQGLWSGYGIAKAKEE